MTSKYKSKPHSIEAFQFQNTNLVPPQWFMKAVTKGEASVTINSNTKHITICGEYNTEKAYLGWWICRADHGKIYVLDDRSFQESYNPE